MNPVLIQLLQNNILLMDAGILVKDLILDKDTKYISGQAIGDSLNISRAAVWKNIKRIESRGFSLISSTKKGYCISAIPENTLIPEYISILYNSIQCDNRIDFKFNYLPSIGSTNDMVKKLVIANRDDSICLVTDFQSEGRGRLDRQWQAQPNKDIAMTVGIHLNENIEEFYKFTMMASIAVYTVLSRYAPGMLIKWPNDILNGKKKICGILSEMITEERSIKTIIIGIGININSRQDDGVGISMADITGREFNRNVLIAEILGEIAKRYDLYRKDRFEEVYAEWKSKLAWIGKKVSINTGRRRIDGILKDVSENGGIIVEENGEEKLYYSGDIMEYL